MRTLEIVKKGFFSHDFFATNLRKLFGVTSKSRTNLSTSLLAWQSELC